MKPSAHLHLIVRAEISNPPGPESVYFINELMKELVKHVRMVVMMGPFTEYCTDQGNEGITSVVVLTTSHASIHIWDNVAPELAVLQLDIYSCSPFTVEEVNDFLRSKFQISKIEYKFLDRETSLIDITDNFGSKLVARKGTMHLEDEYLPPVQPDLNGGHL